MILGIFSQACWSSVGLLWMSIQVLGPFFDGLFVLIFSCMSYFVCCFICKYFFPFLGLTFYFIVSFVMQKLLNLIRSCLFLFSLPQEVGQKRSCYDLCQRVFFLCFSLRILWCPVLHLGLQFILSLFLCVVFQIAFYFYSFTCSCPVFSAPLIEEIVFMVYSCLLNHRLGDHLCVGLSLCFLSCSIGLYFWCFWVCVCVCARARTCVRAHQYHTVALQYSLKSGSLVTLALFFFLKIALAVRGLLCFPTNCKNVCSNS